MPEYKVKLKKKLPPKPRKKKFYYIQDWGTYINETLVVVGMTVKEILRAMKASNVQPHLIKAFERASHRVNFDFHSAGFVWHLNGVTLLYLSDWTQDWEHIETLVHETNHLVQFVFADKKMTDEVEATAYQQEYLFKNIRRELLQVCS